MKFKEGQFRKDIEDYFKLSGIKEYKKLHHTPFIVFNKDVVEICDNAKDLMCYYLNETTVISQWKGEWNSDFFIFKIKDLKEYIKKNPKKDYQII